MEIEDSGQDNLKEESINLEDAAEAKNVDKTVRVVGCQINIRQNGDLQVVVPGDAKMSQIIQTQLSCHLQKILNLPPNSILMNKVKEFNLETLEELEIFERQLKAPLFWARMKEMVKQRGGKKGEDCMKINLAHFITKKLAIEFNWSGKNGLNSFKNPGLATLLIDSILEMNSTMTVYSLEQIIKFWLRQA